MNDHDVEIDSLVIETNPAGFEGEASFRLALADALVRFIETGEGTGRESAADRAAGEIGREARLRGADLGGGGT